MRWTILAPGQNKFSSEKAQDFARVVSETAVHSDRTASVDPGVWTAFRSSGLSTAAFSPVHGGAGHGDPLDQQTLCKVLRLIGAADLSVARLVEGHFNAIMLVCRYGTEQQIQSLAESVEDGALSGVWGAEDSEGLRRHCLGEVWTLEGRKVLASGAGFVTRPLVPVTTDAEHVLYLLDLELGERADTTSWIPTGMRATASGTIDLTGISVGKKEQIGVTGDFMRQPFFSAGAWRFCAAQLGAMERLTALYGDQLRARGRGGDPYQLERLAQCAAACGTALFWVEEAARCFGDDSLAPSAVVAFSNLTRMVTERAGLDVMERVQRGIGLMSFMQPNPIERICRDLATYLRQPVPDLAMSDAGSGIAQW